MELARNAATEITFVSEDDVVSEQIPPPAASASLRKIGAEYTESSSDESIDPKGEIPEGYRLVSMDSLKEFARRIHSNSQCASGEIIIFSYFYFRNSHSIYYKMCFCCCCSRTASSSLSYFLYFCCCRPSRTSRNKYKPIWPQQRHIYAICDGCGLTEFVGTGEHNSLDNGPRTVQWKQGRIQDFFRRGCTRLLLYFNTNKPQFFFAEYQLY